jgi:hypothetical protein
MFLVLIAGLFGYAIGGWLGVAIGALAGAGVAVLSDAITPPSERETLHEHRMRRSRRYRGRYEALEQDWRREYWPSRASGRTVPIEIVPLPAAETVAAEVVSIGSVVPVPLEAPRTKKAKARRQVGARRRSAAT